MSSAAYLEEDYKALAEEKACTVVVRKPNQLLLDIDNGEDYHLCLTRMVDYNDVAPFDFLINDVQGYASSSGLPHRHIVVQLEDSIDDYKAISLQYFLHSDKTKEDLSLLRLIYGLPDPIRLFKPKTAVEKQVNLFSCAPPINPGRDIPFG